MTPERRVAERTRVAPVAPPSGTAVPMGINVISPSYGPDGPTEVALATIPALHALLAPFLAAPGDAVPPAPDARPLMRDGGERVEVFLTQSTNLPGVPNELAALGSDFARQFDQVARSRDYSDEGRARQRNATFGALATALKTQGGRVVKDFARVLDPDRGHSPRRDPGKVLLLGKGVPPEVLQVVGMCAAAPVRFVATLLEQLTPMDPATPGAPLLRENVAAVLWARRNEVPVDLAEDVVSSWRRMQAHDRDADYYAGWYAVARVRAMAWAWKAAADALLLHGVLDPTELVPLRHAFARPDDLLAAVTQAQPTRDDWDILALYGLRAADATGAAGGARSGEAVAPARVPKSATSAL